MSCSATNSRGGGAATLPNWALHKSMTSTVHEWCNSKMAGLSTKMLICCGFEHSSGHTLLKITGHTGRTVHNLAAIYVYQCVSVKTNRLLGQKITNMSSSCSSTASILGWLVSTHIPFCVSSISTHPPIHPSPTAF